MASIFSYLTTPSSGTTIVTVPNGSYTAGTIADTALNHSATGWLILVAQTKDNVIITEQLEMFRAQKIMFVGFRWVNARAKQRGCKDIIFWYNSATHPYSVCPGCDSTHWNVNFNDGAGQDSDRITVAGCDIDNIGDDAHGLNGCSHFRVLGSKLSRVGYPPGNVEHADGIQTTGGVNTVEIGFCDWGANFQFGEEYGDVVNLDIHDCWTHDSQTGNTFTFGHYLGKAPITGSIRNVYDYAPHHRNDVWASAVGQPFNYYPTGTHPEFVNVSESNVVLAAPPGGTPNPADVWRAQNPYGSYVSFATGVVGTTDATFDKATDATGTVLSALAASTITGNLYALVTPTAGGISSVTFKVDGNTIRTESTPPLSLGGDNGPGALLPYDTTVLTDGVHSFTADIVPTSGSPFTKTASVTISNGAPPPPPAVPANTVLPAVSGTPQEGVTLLASTGTWTNNPTSFAYQWKRGATNIGSNSATYLLVMADVGSTITVTVTASNATGASTPAVSAATATVLPAPPPPGPPPVNVSLPVISGVVQEGHSLLATAGTWSNSPTAFIYQWKRGATDIVGTNSSAYSLTSDDVGFVMKVSVIATNSDGPSLPAVSGPTTTVIPIAPSGPPSTNTPRSDPEDITRIQIFTGLHNLEDGIYLGIDGEEFPRVSITPQGSVKVGDGLSAPLQLTGGGTAPTSEEIRDIVTAMVIQGINMQIVNDDNANTMTFNVVGLVPTDIAGMGEYIQDTLAATIANGTNITTNYNDTSGVFTINATTPVAAAVPFTPAGGAGAIIGGTNTQLAVNQIEAALVSDRVAMAVYQANNHNGGVINTANAPYNVKPDLVSWFGSIDVPSNPLLLTSFAGNAPTTGDIGKQIVVAGAGAAGATLVTTIAAVSGSSVTLAAPASTTVVTKVIQWGTDWSTPINQAITDASAAGGGGVLLPKGFMWASVLMKKYVFLQGQGLTETAVYQPPNPTRAVIQTDDYCGFGGIMDMRIDGNTAIMPLSQNLNGVRLIHIDDTQPSTGANGLFGGWPGGQTPHYLLQRLYVTNTSGSGIKIGGAYGEGTYKDLQIHGAGKTNGFANNNAHGLEMYANDSHFYNIAIGAVQGTGFYIMGASNHFTTLKSFFCEQNGFYFGDAGRGGNTQLTMCESQDNTGWGFMIENGHNFIASACKSDGDLAGLLYLKNASYIQFDGMMEVADRYTANNVIKLEGTITAVDIHAMSRPATYSGQRLVLQAGAVLTNVRIDWADIKGLIGVNNTDVLSASPYRGRLQRTTLSANASISAPTEPAIPGTEWIYVFIQDATGGRTVSWVGSWLGNPPTINTAANARTIVRVLNIANGLTPVWVAT